MPNSVFPALSDPAYRIEAELGSGGGGVVYKAWHSRLEKYVVLKRINDKSGIVAAGGARGEADILKNLKHSNLPQLYDFLSDESGIYTVMEFIPGQSFSELLAGGKRFRQPDVVRFAEQLTDALAYMHGQKPSVLHSDIKPGNIMLTPSGDVCLIDFNISLVLEGDSVEALGRSPGYASPEQYGPLGLPSGMQIPPGVSQVPAAPPEAAVSGSATAETALLSATEETALLTATEETAILGAADPESVTEDLAPSEYATEETAILSGGLPATAVTEETAMLPGAAQSEVSRGTVSTAAIFANQQPASPSFEVFSAPQRAASQVRRQRIRLDARSDVYSLGATLYHMLTGKRPEIATGKIAPIREAAPEISRALAYIIDRCMARDPKDRFQSAAELRGAIVNIHKLDARWKRHRVKAAVTAAILTALFAASVATAFLGYRRMGSEKIDKYNTLVLEIAGADGAEAYEEAIKLFPENPAAYREMAAALCVPGSFEECIAFADRAVAKLSAYPLDAAGLLAFGDIYYMKGNSYFELEDYPNSLAAYEAARANNAVNPQLYRDYAIALARCGYIERAETMLGSVKDYDLGDDSVNLLRGEIAYAKGETDAALPLFDSVIRSSDDVYVRYRAYAVSVKAYRARPELAGDEIALLRGALSDLPVNYSRILNERLADALVRRGAAGDLEEAIALFAELRENGNISYLTAQNIGLLYQRLGDYAGAESLYQSLTGEYPDDYRPWLRLAVLEFETQMLKPNDARDYSKAARYYESSRELYGSRGPSAGDDPEMLQLEYQINELKQLGWL